MEMYIFIDENALWNHFPMKPAVAYQPLGKFGTFIWIMFLNNMFQKSDHVLPSGKIYATPV